MPKRFHPDSDIEHLISQFAAVLCVLKLSQLHEHCYVPLEINDVLIVPLAADADYL